MSAQYKSILKYLGLFGGIQGLNLLIGLIRSKIVAVILGPVGMGLSSMLNTAVTFLSNSTNLGIGFSAVKDISEAAELGKGQALSDNKAAMERITTVRVWSLIAAGIGFVVTILAAPVIDYFAFSWGNHTLHFLMLAPTVALLALTGGETAILKATRRMKNLAEVQLATITLSVLIAVPIYYKWEQAGIVPVIFLTALATALATICCSFRHCPYHISRIRHHIRHGTPMVRLGLSFIAAGIMGSGVEMYIRAFLNTQGNLDMVGLYYAAITMAITYPSALLNSLENDYFARLSAVNKDNGKVRQVVNAQMEVMLMVMFPVIAALMLVLPIAVPLLFSSKFNAAIPMTQVTLLAMFLRTATLPIEYISLAKGLSRVYLSVEILSNILILVCLTIGYLYGGLVGMGAGWVAVYGIGLLVVLAISRLKWGFSLSRKAALLLVAEGLALSLLYVVVR